MKMIPPVARGVSPYFHLRFASACDTWVNEWYRFNSLSEIPTCAKYDFPNQISEFRVPHGCNDFQVVHLNLLAALSALPEAERLTLNPARWDRVKKNLSEGWCHMPWMSVSSDGSPMLMDGRHRIVALMKFFNRTDAPFVIERPHVDSIRSMIAKET